MVIAVGRCFSFVEEQAYAISFTILIVSTLTVHTRINRSITCSLRFDNPNARIIAFKKNRLPFQRES